MSVYKNQIDVPLTAEQTQNVETHIGALEASLPFLVSLTSNDRRRLLRLGNKSALFVEKAHELAKQNVEVLPRGMSPDDLDRDHALRELLLPLMQRLTTLLTKVQDSYVLAGSDMMNGAMVVYRSLRAHGDGAGLRELQKELGQRFDRPGRPPAEPDPAPGILTFPGTPE